MALHRCFAVNHCDGSASLLKNHHRLITLPAQAGAVLIGLCQRSEKAQTEQRSGGPASLLAIVPGIVICRCHVATCCFVLRGTDKTCGPRF